jgi:hypothetical protein
MGRLTSEDMRGASDLREEEVYLETLGGSVVVQGLGAAFSNDAQSQALEMKTVGDTQIASVNSALMEEIQIHYGLKDPSLSREEVRGFMERCGPAVRDIVKKIDELSGVDKKAIEETTARFPSSGESSPNKREKGLHAAPAGSGRSSVPSRAGA